jgi:hypothetical protein
MAEAATDNDSAIAIACFLITHSSAESPAQSIPRSGTKVVGDVAEMMKKCM